MSGRFGTPDAIEPQKLLALPPAAQREGALMLLDMGLSPARARSHLGLSTRDFNGLVFGYLAPFRRGGEADVAGGTA